MPSSVKNIISRKNRPGEARPYQYRSLEEGEFRLLLLLPGNPSDEIRIQTEHFYPDKSKDYTALSYTWGDLSDTKRVYCGKAFVTVTTNLWIALRHFKLPKNSLIMWIDAICINQADLAERSSQVLLMPKIYPNARAVWCWLGEDDGTVKKTFDDLRLWAKAYNEPELRLQLSGHFTSELRTSPENGLQAFLSRQWFTRAWTLQEACQGAWQEEPTLLVCSSETIGWHQFYMAFFTISTTLSSEDGAKVFGEGARYVGPMLELHAETRPEMYKLSKLMRLCQYRKASDPRDKIFSLLGLVARFGRNYPLPDYSHSVESVYPMYSRAMIEDDDCLDVLVSAERPKGEDS